MNKYGGFAHVTTRCAHCEELFTGTPVIGTNGKKYCTTVCRAWDGEDPAQQEVQHEALELPGGTRRDPVDYLDV